jgi:hypothetical protein
VLKFGRHFVAPGSLAGVLDVPRWFDSPRNESSVERMHLQLRQGQGISVYPSSSSVRGKLQKRSAREPHISVRFGFSTVDKLLSSGDLRSGDVIVLRGKRGTWKSFVAGAFLFGADLKRRNDTAVLFTSTEAEMTARQRMQQLGELFVSNGKSARTPDRVEVVGLPSGFVEPGFVLQHIEQYFKGLASQGHP